MTRVLHWSPSSKWQPFLYASIPSIMTHNPVFKFWHHALLSGNFFATSNTPHLIHIQPFQLCHLAFPPFWHTPFWIHAVIRLATSELLPGNHWHLLSLFWTKSHGCTQDTTIAHPLWFLLSTGYWEALLWQSISLNIQDVTLHWDTSIVNTLCRTYRPCSGNPGQSSRPSETLIPLVKPLETWEQPFCSSAMHMCRPWASIVSNSGSPQDHLLMSIILNYFEHLNDFFNFSGQPWNSNFDPEWHTLLVDFGTSTL